MRTADRTRTLDRSRGFSLVEVIIAGAILCGIVIMTALMLQSGNRLLGVTSAQAEAENRAGGMAEQVCQRMRDGILSTITDGVGVPLADGATVGTGVGVQTFIDWKGGPVAGQTFRFVLRNGEANVINAVDDDRDNYVDEMSLHMQMWPGPPIGLPATTAEIGRNVKSFSVTRIGRRISVAITVMRYDATQREVRTFVHYAEASLRN